MKGDNVLVNVRLKSGKVSRVARSKAEALVSDGANYISRSKYKKALGLKLTEAQERDLKHKNPS